MTAAAAFWSGSIQKVANRPLFSYDVARDHLCAAQSRIEPELLDEFIVLVGRELLYMTAQGRADGARVGLSRESMS